MVLKDDAHRIAPGLVCVGQGASRGDLGWPLKDENGSWTAPLGLVQTHGLSEVNRRMDRLGEV